MDILLFLLIGQLLVFGTYASDKELKKVPNTKQAIIPDNENVTDSCKCADIGPDTVLSAEIYNNSRAPETFTNGMSSDNSGEPETSVTNEMTSDNSCEPETLVSNEMDREHSANEDSPDKADDNDHCSSNPCKNEGTCIEEGDDYSCKCTHHWYSGKNCDKDDGPCKTCSERGTARCVYSGPGGTVTSCVCNAWYKGDKCDYFHDNVKNWLRNATGIDISDDFFDELVKRIDNGDIQIPTGYLRKALSDLDDFDQVYKKSGLGKLGSGSIGYIDNVDRVLGKELGYGKMMSVIEGFKQKLQRQHQQN